LLHRLLLVVIEGFSPFGLQVIALPSVPLTVDLSPIGR
jgi:hypothetical protein